MAVTFGCPLVGPYDELRGKHLKVGQRAYATKGYPEHIGTNWKTGAVDDNGNLIVYENLDWDTNNGGDNETPDLSNYCTKEEIERLQYYGDKDTVPSYENSFAFTLFDDKTASISLKEVVDKDSITELIIPYKYIDDDEKEYKITSIGDQAFYYCSSLTSIDIPDSVTSIGMVAFCGCSRLTNIDIPDNVTSIGDGAFESCESLMSINMPDSVTSIGNSAFFGCSENFTIICNPGSTAEAYAKENNIKYAYNYIEPNTKIITADVEIPEGDGEAIGVNPSMTYDEAYDAFMEGKQVYMQGSIGFETIRLAATYINNEQEYIRFLSLTEIGLGISCFEATYQSDGTIKIKKGAMEKQDNRVDTRYGIAGQYPDSYPSTIATYDFVESEMKPLLDRITQLEQQLAELKNNS